MEVAYDAGGLATPLIDGDLVRVYSILPQYRKTVILRGNIANPGRFAWHPGMRVSELIPDRDSLVTRDYWWKRAQLGLPAAEFEPAKGLDDLRQPRDNHAVNIKEPSADEKNTANPPTAEQNNSSTTTTTGATTTVGAETSASQDLTAVQRSGNSTLAAQRSSGSPHIPNGTQRTEVRSLAPEIDWDYAVVERLDSSTLKTVLLPFDLGRLVQQHDAGQDVELLAGDVVSIFSEADIHVPNAEQTKLVTLSGEFAHAGTYTAQPGETLRHLVERAGGFTSGAYVFGSEFTRESARVMQQSRLDEYIQGLNMRLQRTNLAMAASAVISAQDLASSAAGQSSEKELLASLRQIRATGRIVLKFKPDTTGTDSLPDVVLEDGDRFTVPPIPATVNVVGAVYDQNSFLFAQDRRLGQFLQLAGGANRDADQKHEFLIRADGEVVSRDRERALWGSEFSNLRIYPGDTIVVPEKTFKPTALRGILDWTQTFSQLALGAGVLSTVLP
jgi:protein involved in polysaccharide export with SLBB domain